MKPLGTLGGLAGAMALSCLLGLAPRAADAATLLSGCGGGDFGDNCSLAELAFDSSRSITIDSTVFNNFGFDPGTLNANAILVAPIDVSSYHPGFALFASSDPTIGFTEDFFVVFDVSSSGGQIHGASLTVVLADKPAINSFFDVFADLGPTQISVDCDLTAPNCVPNASTSLDYVSALPNVLLGTLGATDLNSISVQFDVPEPGSLALLALGLSGIGVSSRRRRQLATS